jgi:glycerol-3-phosphate dehydrogenase (NAD(P)+)
MKIAILGGGAWGTALAIHLTPRHQVALWSRDPDQVQRMDQERENRRYLPGCSLPPALKLESDLSAACLGADLLIVAVPAAAFRSILQTLAAEAKPLIWVCKGLEPGTGKWLDQVAEETFTGKRPRGVLSGPSFAQEVAAGLPAALTLASRERDFARQIARELHGGNLRVYISEDVIGVEMGGALKNVVAIAAGICDGLKLGHNARAALITRGLAEMTRLGVKLGGHFETFMGLSGLGDLILTTTGDLSRNRQVGLRLARGQQLDAILGELGHVAEGVTTAPEVAALAGKLGLEMPITRAVCRVLFESLPASEAVDSLLNREIRAEF